MAPRALSKPPSGTAIWTTKGKSRSLTRTVTFFTPGKLVMTDAPTVGLADDAGRLKKRLERCDDLAIIRDQESKDQRRQQPEAAEYDECEQLGSFERCEGQIP